MLAQDQPVRDDADPEFITISGVVKDKNNKKRLEYVNISIPGSTSGTITNEDGEFSFKIKKSAWPCCVIMPRIRWP